jgi:hypothetical protein
MVVVSPLSDNAAFLHDFELFTAQFSEELKQGGFVFEDLFA